MKLSALVSHSTVVDTALAGREGHHAPPSVSSELQSRTMGKRILALDSLRGLAACVVVLYHLRAAYIEEPPRWFLRPFFAGLPAVILFFALSGYVLALPYWRGSQPNYGKYLLRRFFRIYVPYAAAMGLALAVGQKLLFAQLPLTPWFYKTWHTAFTAGLVAKQFFTISTGAAINTAAWSLRYEMEMSIIFPLICWIIPRLGRWGAPILFIISFEAATMLFHLKHHPNLLETANAVRFGGTFFLGALLSWKRDAVRRLYHRTPRIFKVLLLALTAIGYFAPKFVVVLPFAACMVIVFAEHSFCKRFLEHSIPEYLGRISYSLYLVHGTVLFAALILLYGRVPFAGIAVTYILTSLFVAHIFCVLVEEPSLRLGKRLTHQQHRDSP